MTISLDTLLKDKFGFDRFRPGQREVCESLVAGHSAAAVFPTGGGKSLCYQLPALAVSGTTIVVSPLIALMKDQIDALAARGVAAARLDSSLTAEEFRTVTRHVRRGDLKLLYVAPERFTNERFRALLADTPISLFAVDEAHCISEWGHNFRPDYLKLARFAHEAGAETILALTATATPPVLDDICRFFDIEPARAVRTPFHRPNLVLGARRVVASDRKATLIELLKARLEGGSTIVYVTLQKTAMDVAAQLHDAGFPARPYHAGLPDELRAKTQDWFMASPEAIVVATIAFGMGIDKANIRAVVHYNLPKSLENYAQEIGRAGRDGQTSRCELLACVDDRGPLENFIHGDTPEEAGVLGLVETMLGGDEEISVALSQLSSLHDIRPLVVRTLLTYLGIDKWLEELTPIYGKYQFKALVASERMFSHFEGDEQQFMRTLLAQAVAARKWLTIDLERAIAATSSDRRRIVQALDLLADRGFVELKPSGLVHRFRRIRDGADLGAVAADLVERMRQRAIRDLERLDLVTSFAEASDCLSSRIGAHFGEPLDEPCGECSSCRGTGIDASETTPPAAPALDESLWQRAVEFRDDEMIDAIATPVAMARFLCGIASPRLSRARLTRHELFGSAEDVAFTTVLERARASI